MAFSSPEGENWGGLAPAQIRVINVGVASGPFLGSNKKRLKLTLLRPTVAAYTLTTANPAVNGVGLVVNPGGDPLVLSTEDYGDFLTRDLFCISAGAAQTVRCIEIQGA